MFIQKEIIIIWNFIKKDLTATVIPASLFMVASFLKNPSPVRLIAGEIYFILFVYTFTLGNQIHGVEEDRLNKPFRPIPSGLVSADNAVTRWFTASVLFLLLGIMLGIGFWAMAWVVLTHFMTRGNWDKFWITKNALPMSAGTICQLAAAWQIFSPLTLEPWRWILSLALWAGLTMDIQDFRDIDGDRKIGRRTLPLAIGEMPARYAVAFCQLLASVMLILILFPYVINARHIIYVTIISIFSLTIAIRLLLFRYADSDHKTYIAHTLHYVVLLFFALIELSSL